MNTHADKTQENKSQSVVNEIAQKQNGSESTFQFVDNRPEAFAQRKLQEVMNNSRQVNQLKAFQEMANNSPQAKQAAQLQSIADNYSAKQQQPIQKKENNTGLPDKLKAGIENLSGYSMDDVKVHYNSDKPAQLQAYAYAQGTDIHLGSGQEKHLLHEAWHVVQQKQGRVKPTRQMKGKVNINDDAGLEKEADIMGQKAFRYTVQETNIDLNNGNTNAQTVQRVRGGMEFTEDNSTLDSFATPAAPALGGGIARHSTFNIGGSQISVFVVPNHAALGAWRNQDFTLLTSAQVSLTNDVSSAEWVIARHGANVTSQVMKANMLADINSMFDMRRELANRVNTLQGANPGSVITLVPGNVALLHAAPDPEGIFQYIPGNSEGMAQITIQYSNVDTIERINKLNASKYLTGTKVAVGEDAKRVARTESNALRLQDVAGTTSFSSAGALKANLSATSNPIVDAVTGNTVLDAAQIGLVKLMVLNDALATTMVRYNAGLGQAQEKNIQRFFPKSRRDEYTKAVARANISAANMLLIRAEINRTAAADALLFYNAADAGALRVDEAFTEITNQYRVMNPLPPLAPPDTRLHPDVPGMITARGVMAGQIPGPPNAGDVANIKDHVLGANGALLATWIGRAAGAYTDVSVAGNDHWQGAVGGVGTVIGSTRGFTPVAGGGQAAVYEFREREVAMEEPRWYKIGSISEAKEILATLFDASE